MFWSEDMKEALGFFSARAKAEPLRRKRIARRHSAWFNNLPSGYIYVMRPIDSEGFVLY